MTVPLVLPPLAPAPSRPRFGRMARASLILGVVGLVCSPIPVLSAFACVGAIVGLCLGLIALFGARRRLAGAGAVLCLVAVVITALFQAPPSASVPPPPSVSVPAPPSVSSASPPATSVPEATTALVEPTTDAPAAPEPGTGAGVRPQPTTSPAPEAPPTTPRASTTQPVPPAEVSGNDGGDDNGGNESVYYKNCAAARAAGAAPLYAGDPGYRAGLDRDGDGVACE